MITAVDTNVLLDLIMEDPVHEPESRARLAAAHEHGTIIICDIVYAELAPAAGARDALDAILQRIGADVSPIDTAIAWEAGERWGQYRRAGGTRQRILADFLIGAHAAVTADVLLTRDERFYSTYFPELAGAGSS